MLTLDLHHIPLARRGSWLCLSRPSYPATGHPAEGPGLYLRSNRNRPYNRRELVKIEVLRNGHVVHDLTETADPSGITLGDEHGATLELAFAAANTLQVSGTGGLSIRLVRQPLAGEVAYPIQPEIFAINCRQSLSRIAVECLCGHSTLSVDWAPDQCHGEMIIAAEPDQNGRLSVAIDEWQSTWHRGPRLNIHDLRQEITTEFADFQKQLNRTFATSDEHLERCAYLLWSCTVPARGLLRREGVLMSRNWMDSIWSWDNCFNAMALAASHPQLAIDQLLIERDFQDADGAYPDAVNDGFAHYNFSKPPVQGITYRWIQHNVPRFWTKTRLKPFYESVSRFTQWWLDHRRWPESALCHYLHGNDSGWDNSTIFDQGAPLQSPDLAAFLIVQMDTLADMAQRLGDEQAANHWQQQTRQMQEALINNLWDGQRFNARLAASGEKVLADSLIPCMPVVLGQRLPAAVRQQLINEIERFITPWGVATEDPQSNKFTEDGYWRGPVWAPSTMLIVNGLMECREKALAQRIAKGFVKACEHGGFAENFSALSGNGLRDRAYTWTAAVYRCLRPLNREDTTP